MASLLDNLDNKFKVHVVTDTDTFTLEGRTCTLSAYSHIRTTNTLPKERVYFNTPRKHHPPKLTYDRVFPPIPTDYNPKLHRCDRKHAKLMGLTTNEEEHTRLVPCLASTTYGFYLKRSTEKPERIFARIMRVKNEFYRRNGVFSKLDYVTKT